MRKAVFSALVFLTFFALADNVVAQVPSGEWTIELRATKGQVLGNQTMIILIRGEGEEAFGGTSIENRILKAPSLVPMNLIRSVWGRLAQMQVWQLGDRTEEKIIDAPEYTLSVMSEDRSNQITFNNAGLLGQNDPFLQLVLAIQSMVEGESQ